MIKEKIVEILIYIMSEIQENKRLNEIDLADLKEKGYTQSEISAALGWLYDNMRVTESAIVREGKPSGESRRILHEAEKFVLSTESQGYLIQLTELGLLDDTDLENIIERAMLAGYEKITLGELQEIVASVLLTKTGGGAGANRWTPNNKDTIH
jgi:uncharacterized protein Smg (DUF494 family)